MSFSTQVIEVVRPAMEDPKFAYAAVGTFIGGTALDFLKQSREANAARDAVPIADPELAGAAKITGNRTRRLARFNHYAAVAFASLMVAQESHPYTTHSHAKGSASVVIDTGYGANVRDMSADSGGTESRLDASIDGSLAAAENNDVPFSFILEGQKARVVDTTPAKHKDLKQTRRRIDQTLNPDFRNGQSLADGAEQALSLTGTGPNDIILLAANTRPDDQRDLGILARRMKRAYPEDSLHAVVVGRGAGEVQVGNVSVQSATNPGAFSRLFGRENVETAQSSTEVEQAISKIISKEQITEKKDNLHNYEHLALIAAALGAAGAIRRRLSGITRLGREGK